MLYLILLSEAMKRFLAEFHVVDDNNGQKKFKYAKQLVDIAHREQVSLTLELDDIGKFFPKWISFEYVCDNVTRISF